MITVYGASWCNDCRHIRSWLKHRQLPYDYVDIEENEAANKRLKVLLGEQPLVVPVLELGDSRVLINPTLDALAEALPGSAEVAARCVDVAVIGAGPAGLTAAIYLARERSDVLIIDRAGAGGHAASTAKIENYPGFTEPIGGLQLMQAMEQQAIQFGAETLMGVEVTSLTSAEDVIRLETSGETIQANAVVLALGTDYKHLGVPGEVEYTGRGVHYCATCDGPFYRDKEVLVIGGGNSAVQEAIFLASFVKKLTLISWEPGLTATTLLTEKLHSFGDKIVVEGNLATNEITHEHGRVTGIQAVDRETQESRHFSADGVFVFIGLEPKTSWLKDTVALDARGFITTNQTLETSLPGVFAAGDCRAGATMQVAAATGEGATAAIMIRHYLNQHL